MQWEKPHLSNIYFSTFVIVSGFALWHRSTVGWVIAAVAHAAAAWLLWVGLRTRRP